MDFEPITYILLAAFLGLLVGSFLNVVIYRLPLMLEKQWQVLA
ncbi:MAG: prepilin peptidase, partial [Eikenella sp.]|nr:prepilin peptidase [Eikenella sp.]